MNFGLAEHKAFGLSFINPALGSQNVSVKRLDNYSRSLVIFMTINDNYFYNNKSYKDNDDKVSNFKFLSLGFHAKYLVLEANPDEMSIYQMCISD